MRFEKEILNQKYIQTSSRYYYFFFHVLSIPRSNEFNSNFRLIPKGN